MDTPNNTRKAGDVISDINHIRNYTQVQGVNAGISVLTLMIPSGGADELNQMIAARVDGGTNPRTFKDGEIAIGVVPSSPGEKMMLQAMGVLLPTLHLTREQVLDLHDTLGAILGGWPCTLPVTNGVVALTADQPGVINAPE